LRQRQNTCCNSKNTCSRNTCSTDRSQRGAASSLAVRIIGTYK